MAWEMYKGTLGWHVGSESRNHPALIQNEAITHVTGMVPLPCDFCPYPFTPHPLAPQAQKVNVLGWGLLSQPLTSPTRAILQMNAYLFIELWLPVFPCILSQNVEQMQFLEFQGEQTSVFVTTRQQVHPSCCVCTWYARAVAPVKWAVTASPVGLGQQEGHSIAPSLQLMGIRLHFQMLTLPYLHCPPAHCPLVSEGECSMGTPLGSCGDFCIDPASWFFPPLSPFPQCWYFCPLSPLSSSSLGSLVQSPLETKGMRRDFPFF